MSHQMQPPYTCSSSPVQMPAKRKRGRPRKDEGQSQSQVEKSLHKLLPVTAIHQVDQSTLVPLPPYVDKGKEQRVDDADQAGGLNNDDEMVGQMVTGVVESVFDAGYLLTVKVGDTYMRGVVFQGDKIVPITSQNDIAPNVKMYPRKQQQFENAQIEKHKGHGSSSSSSLPMAMAMAMAHENHNVVPAEQQQQQHTRLVLVPEPEVSPEPGPSQQNHDGNQDQSQNEPEKKGLNLNEKDKDGLLLPSEDGPDTMMMEPGLTSDYDNQNGIGGVVQEEGESLVEKQGKEIGSPNGGNHNAPPVPPPEAENVASMMMMMMPIDQQNNETLNELPNKGDDQECKEEAGSELKEKLPCLQMEKAAEEEPRTKAILNVHSTITTDDKSSDQAIVDNLTKTDLNEGLLESEAGQPSAPNCPRIGSGQGAIYGEYENRGNSREAMDCE
ncbi:hypothetical protein Dimus_032932 [Dionaea muscipula]